MDKTFQPNSKKKIISCKSAVKLDLQQLLNITHFKQKAKLALIDYFKTWQKQL